MENELNLKLLKLCSNLGGAESLNYSCSSRVYSGDWLEGLELNFLLKNIMGSEPSIANLRESSLPTMVDVIRESFSYSGDSGSHPNLAYFESAQFSRELEEIIADLESQFSGCSNVYSFYISSGHPFYPVFWEFSFLLKLNQKAYLVIGSSSD